MRPTAGGYRVAVVGASSLLGKELLTALEERRFPIWQLIKFGAADEESDLPIVDLLEYSQEAVASQDVDERELDFAFLAARLQADSDEPLFLRRARNGATPDSSSVVSHCRIIDMSEALAEAPDKVLTVPFLDHGSTTSAGHVGPNAGAVTKIFVSAHPAAILISSLLLRLAARFRLERAVAQVFVPASERGARGIEELQKQTVSLLSFQKVPQTVFGAQLAFNLLPRLNQGRPGARVIRADALADLENRLRGQLREYLSERAPVPALSVFQTAVFYSVAVSLYVELSDRAAPEAVVEALEGAPIRARRISQPAPSQVEVTGSDDIVVDTIAADADHPRGIWLWAVADNLRLASRNAIDIAEGLRGAVAK